MGYIITKDYGTDIDPIATTTLSFKWNADSIITAVKKRNGRK